MASLDDLADTWDSIDEVRDRMRKHRRLFAKEDGQDKPLPTIACGQLNFHVLKPLVSRLEESPGVAGMHSIPDLQKQTLVIYLSTCCSVPTIVLVIFFCAC